MISKLLKNYVKDFNNIINNNMEGETKQKLKEIEKLIPDNLSFEEYQTHMIKNFTSIILEADLDFNDVDESFKDFVDAQLRVGNKMCKKVVVKAALKKINNKKVENDCMRCLEIPGGLYFSDLACFIAGAFGIESPAPYSFEPKLRGMPVFLEDGIFTGDPSTCPASEVGIADFNPENLNFLEFHYLDDNELVFSLEFVSILSSEKWFMPAEASVLSGVGCIPSQKDDIFDLKKCNEELFDNYTDFLEIYHDVNFSDEDPEDIDMDVMN